MVKLYCVRCCTPVWIQQFFFRRTPSKFWKKTLILTFSSRKVWSWLCWLLERINFDPNRRWIVTVLHESDHTLNQKPNETLFGKHSSKFNDILVFHDVIGVVLLLQNNVQIISSFPCASSGILCPTFDDVEAMEKATGRCCTARQSWCKLLNGTSILDCVPGAWIPNICYFNVV